MHNIHGIPSYILHDIPDNNYINDVHGKNYVHDIHDINYINDVHDIHDNYCIQHFLLTSDSMRTYD